MANNQVIAATQPQMAPPVEEASENQNAVPDAEGRWQEYWHGQRQINGLLFEANNQLITAIRELKKAVVQALEPHGVEADLSSFYQATKRAEDLVKQIPAVNPPGCILPPGNGDYTSGGTDNGGN